MAKYREAILVTEFDEENQVEEVLKIFGRYGITWELGVCLPPDDTDSWQSNFNYDQENGGFTILFQPSAGLTCGGSNDLSSFEIAKWEVVTAEDFISGGHVAALQISSFPNEQSSIAVESGILDESKREFKAAMEKLGPKEMIWMMSQVVGMQEEYIRTSIQDSKFDLATSIQRIILASPDAIEKAKNLFSEDQLKKLKDDISPWMSEGMLGKLFGNR